MSYTPYATSANATGTTGQPNAVILKVSAGGTLTKNRIVTLSSDDADYTLTLSANVLSFAGGISVTTGAFSDDITITAATPIITFVNTASSNKTWIAGMTAGTQWRVSESGIGDALIISAGGGAAFSSTLSAGGTVSTTVANDAIFRATSSIAGGNAYFNGVSGASADMYVTNTTNRTLYLGVGSAAATTVAINASGMNGALGQTTPAAASVTTLSASGRATFSQDLILGNTYTLSWGGAYGAGIPTIAGSTGAGTLQFYPTGTTNGAVATISATGLALTTSSANPITATSTAVVTAFSLDNTHANNWGSNIEFKSSGNSYGFVGLYGSLVGSTDHSTVLYANTGQVAKIYANGNNLSATFTSAGINGVLGGTTPAAASVTTLTAVTGTFTKATAGDSLVITNGGASNKTGYLGTDATYVYFTGGAYLTSNGIYFDQVANTVGLQVSGATKALLSSTLLTVTGGVIASAGLKATGAIPADATSTSCYDYFSNTSRFFSYGDVSTQGQFLWYAGLGGASPTQLMGLTGSALTTTAGVGIVSGGSVTSVGNVLVNSSGPYVVLNRAATTDYAGIQWKTAGATTNGWEIYATNVVSPTLQIYSYALGGQVMGLSTTGVGILGATIGNALDVNGDIRVQGGNRSLKFNNGSVEFRLAQNAGATASLDLNANLTIGGEINMNGSALILGGAISGGGASGILHQGSWSSAALTAGGTVFNGYFGLSGSSIVPSIFTFLANGGNLGTATVTNYYAFYFGQGNVSGATNIMAFRSELNSGSGRWAFYGNGTAPSHFGGNVDVTGTLGASSQIYYGTIDSSLSGYSAKGSVAGAVIGYSAWNTSTAASSDVAYAFQTQGSRTANWLLSRATGLLEVTDGFGTRGTVRFSIDPLSGNTLVNGTLGVAGSISASNLSGTNTGDQTNVSGSSGSCTGNALTATTLQTTRTIGGSNFNGSANVTSFPIPGDIGGTTPANITGTTIRANSGFNYNGTAGSNGTIVLATTTSITVSGGIITGWT